MIPPTETRNQRWYNATRQRALYQ